MRFLCVFVVTVTCWFLVATVRADVIKLNDGTEVRGQIVAEMDDVVIVQTATGSRKLRLGEIKEMVRSEVEETSRDVFGPKDPGFAILSPESDSTQRSSDPETPAPDGILVLGRVWSKDAGVTVTVRKNGKVRGTVSAVVEASDEGEGGEWHAMVRLSRGYNTIEAKATQAGRDPASHSVRTFLDPIFPAQAGKPYLNEDGSQQLDRNGKPVPNDISGIVTLSYTVRDRKDVRRTEIMIDGEVVSRKSLYLWDTSKCSKEAHVITYMVEYADGEIYHGTARAYRSQQVRSKLVSGGTPPWRRLNEAAQDLYKQKKYMEAFETAANAVVSAQKNAGRNHPDTAVVFCTLGTICESVLQYPEAEKCYKRALTIFEEKLGKDHRQVGGVLTMMARLYRSMGKPEEARPLEERSRRILSGK